MALIKFNNRLPWLNSELSDFFDTDDFFKDAFWTKAMIEQPALNIKESEESFELEMAAPGLSKDDFNISIDDGYLNISAEKKETKEEEEANYTRKEFNYNSFKRSLLLPDSILEDDVDATYNEGLLRIKLNKKEDAKKHTSKTINVK
ncbi:HSP20 family protein [Zhouia amylolytica]|uniref:SHSP domain-containing protein n=2 Tax=Zhouia amylolytica TaxID=376730 RepID=W2ULN6_9FLAO|nr:Hsp20/alpha crystallin family protein [Zhouia amylolytica]ETN94928.1 hypothetical protein P278_20860 [Zhouia amylolytica AD3]MCQ0110525.1 Hsp20/alpha crystallin family protein [Zhouia amylolytica]SFS65827.1 HSP20 family protein [Zhouia amylolytica]